MYTLYNLLYFTIYCQSMVNIQIVFYCIEYIYFIVMEMITTIIILLERNQSEYDSKWIYLYHCSYIQFGSSCKYSSHITRIRSQTFLPVYSTRCINLYRTYDSMHVRFLGFTGNRIDIFRIEKSTFIFYVVPYVITL